MIERRRTKTEDSPPASEGALQRAMVTCDDRDEYPAQTSTVVPVENGRSELPITPASTPYALRPVQWPV